MSFLSLARFVVHSHPLVLYGACLFIAWFVLGRSRCFQILQLVRRRAVLLSALVVFAALLSWYLVLPQYADHAEPSIAAVSWLVAQGASPYHLPGGSEIYAFPYGPVLYFGNAAVMRAFGPSLLTSKLLAAGCVSASVLIVGLAASRHRVSVRDAILACLVAYLAFGTASFWVRAEPLLLLYVSLGLLSMTLTRPAGPILLGIVLGLSVATKVTGLIYLAPAILAVTSRHGWRAVPAACSAALLSFALPFVLSSSVDIGSYVYWLRTATDHGMRWQSLPGLVEWAVVLCGPIVIALYDDLYTHPRHSSNDYPARLTLAICLLGSVVLAAKRGTGPHHFLPFVPSVAILAQRPPAENGTVHQSTGVRAVLALALTGLILAVTAQSYWITFVAADAASGPLKELTALSRQYQGPLAVGYSRNYRLSFLRPVPVFAGQPYQLDAVALMDAGIAGKTMPHNVLQSLAACHMRTWLIPQGGVPFELSSAYDATKPVFGATFIQLFQANYSLVHAGRYFDVWQCKWL